MSNNQATYTEEMKGQDMEVNSPQAGENVLDDGANATSTRVDNMHGVRYIEMFLAANDAKTGNLVAACYNSMLHPSGIPASRDTAPQSAVEGLDFDKMKEDFGVLGASLNGPKLWLSDWAEFEVGAIRDFNGIKAPWIAQLNMAGGGAVSESESYAPTTIARNSAIGWNKGTTALLLDDAEGNTWIMKGFQLGLDPRSPSSNSLPPARATSRNSRRAGRYESKCSTRISSRRQKAASPRSCRTNSSTCTTRPDRA